MTLPIPSQSDSISTAGPLARYRAGAARGEIRSDPRQELIAGHLDRLHTALGGYAPAVDSSRWLGWAKRERRKPAPRGLYLHGGVGRGKSMLMDLFFRSAPVVNKRRVHFHAFMAEIHARLHAFRQARKSTNDDPLALVAGEVAGVTWLLCFDEFVINNIADAMILGRLFQALLDRGVVIVATSNFAPQDLYKDGLQRDRFEPFIAMLADRLDVLALDGPQDYRLSRVLGRPVYLSPLGEEAEVLLDRAWDDLTDEAKGEAETVHVLGREIPVPRAARGVARFSFADLCARPLGASDYLALAERYHTIMVDGVPLLGEQNHNEARRFITLIDALYEAKTRLFVVAAAEPTELYRAGQGAFEFTRTVSRLMEMQSEEYLAGIRPSDKTA